MRLAATATFPPVLRCLPRKTRRLPQLDRHLAGGTKAGRAYYRDQKGLNRAAGDKCHTQ